MDPKQRRPGQRITVLPTAVNNSLPFVTSSLSGKPLLSDIILARLCCRHVWEGHAALFRPVLLKGKWYSHSRQSPSQCGVGGRNAYKRSPHRTVELGGTSNRALGSSRSSSPGNSLSRVNPEEHGCFGCLFVFIKLGVRDNYFQALPLPRWNDLMSKMKEVVIDWILYLPQIHMLKL